MRVFIVAAAAAAGLTAAAGLVPGAAPASAASRIITPLPVRLLVPHNAERARHGVAPLVWDARLAAAADRYAAELAATGRWGHSDKATRPGQGENLWMGTRGAFSPEQMVEGWLSERRYYRHGVFPHVSRTSNWADVGHYSQIIWRGTTHVGCAIRSGRGNDYLVCRYAPHGNVYGRSVV